MFLVLVPHIFSSDPTFLAALSSVYFVPFSSVYFSTVRSGGWTVAKNANHFKSYSQRMNLHTKNRQDIYQNR
jgi:hypothetical protein